MYIYVCMYVCMYIYVFIAVFYLSLIIIDTTEIIISVNTNTSPHFFYILRLILFRKSVKSSLSLPFLKFCFFETFRIKRDYSFIVLRGRYTFSRLL